MIIYHGKKVKLAGIKKVYFQGKVVYPSYYPKDTVFYSKKDSSQKSYFDIDLSKINPEDQIRIVDSHFTGDTFLGKDMVVGRHLGIAQKFTLVISLVNGKCFLKDDSGESMTRFAILK